MTSSRKNKPIIEVKHLSKEYAIGSDRSYKRLSESISNALRNPLTSLKGLHEQKDTFWALKDINLEVERGEVLGIIGRNGAGKSTLLKVLARITHPTEGEVRLRGRVGSLLEVGTGFHPELTGRENIYFNGSILGMKKKEIDDKFDEIVKFSGIERHLDTPTKRYSSGMNVRLAFSVAAHLDPEILLVDEVLAVGDAEFQKKCLGKMSEVAEGGRTVLFVSHNMGAVQSLCNRAIFIECGELIQDGETASIISSYLSGNQQSITSNSLLNHPFRSKGFQELLVSFSIESPADVCYHGKPVIFKVGFSFPDTVYTPQFVIIIYSMNGVRVFTLISDYQENNIPSAISGSGEVLCTIPKLPLMPGKYYISLKLWQPGQKLDEIENVMQFSVEWLDRSIGQYNWNDSMGVVYVGAEWILA
jgi:lipopolysaccharide transport system ATP-binding protein